MAVDYIKENPDQEVEVYFRRGVYRIDSGDRPAIFLRDINTVKRGKFIIAGEGKLLST